MYIRVSENREREREMLIPSTRAERERERGREGGWEEGRERLQIPGVHSSATQPAAMATSVCRNPKVPTLRSRDEGTTHSITGRERGGEREGREGEGGEKERQRDG